MRLEIHYADEWAALYVDGALETCGDSYVAEERALDMLGVKIVRDDAFMRGQTQRSGVAQTVAEVDEYRAEISRRAAEAERLESAAAEMMARAAEIRQGKA